MFSWLKYFLQKKTKSSSIVTFWILEQITDQNDDHFTSTVYLANSFKYTQIPILFRYINGTPAAAGSTPPSCVHFPCLPISGGGAFTYLVVRVRGFTLINLHLSFLNIVHCWKMLIVHCGTSVLQKRFFKNFSSSIWYKFTQAALISALMLAPHCTLNSTLWPVITWQGDRKSSENTFPISWVSNFLKRRLATGTSKYCSKWWSRGLKSRCFLGLSPPKEPQWYLQWQQRWRRNHYVWAEASIIATFWRDPSQWFRGAVWMARLFQDMKGDARSCRHPKCFKASRHVETVNTVLCLVLCLWLG